MKKFMTAFTVLVLFVIASRCIAGDVKSQQVWLLAGQSNMIGYGTNSADLPPSLQQPQSNVKIFTDTSTGWTNLAPGLGPSSTQFGPELTFGRDLAAALPDTDILLIKARFGLGNLYNDWRSPNTGRGEAGPHYKRFVDLVKKAMESKPDAKIVGMIWMQGEGDGYDDLEKAKNYAKNLSFFLIAYKQI